MVSEYLLSSPQSIGMSIPNIVSSYVEQDDIALVSASQVGDQDAFALLVQRHQRYVFNLVFRMLGQYEDANGKAYLAFVAMHASQLGCTGLPIIVRLNNWNNASVIKP